MAHEDDEQPLSKLKVDEARVVDALRWVAQEARAVVMVGTPLPKGSRLREAFEQLDIAYRKLS